MTSIEDDAKKEDAEAPVAPPAKSTKQIVIAWARRVLVLVVIGFAGWQVAKSWNEVWATLKTLSWSAVLISELFVLAGIFLGAYAWQIMVDDLGKPIGFLRGSQFYLVGSLGKYVPGSVWAYLLQMELGRKAGVPRARIFVGTLISLGVSVVAMSLLGLLSLPSVLDHAPNAVWLFALLPLGIIALHPKVLTWGTSLVLKLLRKAPLDHELRYGIVGKLLGVQVASYVCYGTHLWVLAESAGSPTFRDWLLTIGAISVGLLGGIFVFILPSGAGVRDAILVGVLASTLPASQALAFALVSRLMFIVGEVLSAGVGWVLPKLKRTPAEVPAEA
ncbi:lysylphosphatidylglycerol synthase transmembrane domain-containing protein [Kibdelosporangium aridum]|uniref:Uncharacterized protein n=1 Tax=Kibdelosporangium aridum TaxID=2030 RepID=A0A1W2DKL1_KIBAR|nr:lysylphosphatidylglycerol synthase transmembrane domain-containing protein [Kibdelosporangium aridum]SMC97582.1 hypothetical protein SAMN05661093_03450 [Kibdelosporangium aridum]